VDGMQSKEEIAKEWEEAIARIHAEWQTAGLIDVQTERQFGS
jgi:hypothetical protein